MRKQTMSRKLTNLVANELTSIFGGESDTTCICYNYNHTKLGFSPLKDFIIHLGLTKFECRTKCKKTHEKHLYSSRILDLEPISAEFSNQLPEITCFTPTY